MTLNKTLLALALGLALAACKVPEDQRPKPMVTVTQQTVTATANVSVSPIATTEKEGTITRYVDHEMGIVCYTMTQPWIDSTAMGCVALKDKTND